MYEMIWRQDDQQFIGRTYVKINGKELTKLLDEIKVEEGVPDDAANNPVLKFKYSKNQKKSKKVHGNCSVFSVNINVNDN
jgi:hypothetical protein